MQYKILNHFDQCLVVFKPHGFLSIPARDANDPRPVLGRLLEQELKTKIYPVHRLDFEVSGLILYALSAPMHQLLSHSFEKHLIEKTYYALGENHQNNREEQIWKSILLKGKKRTYEAPYGKPSLTHATCLKNITLLGKNFSHWELNPKTGRSHQLRFEMMKHGHVIVGDKLYGSETPSFAANSISLCSAKISFPEICQKSPWNLPSHIALTSEEISQVLFQKHL